MFRLVRLVSVAWIVSCGVVGAWAASGLVLAADPAPAAAPAPAPAAAPATPPPAAAPAAPPTAAIVKLEVFPPDVRLNTRRDVQHLVVQATRADGITLDVTGEAQFKLLDSKPVRLEGHALYPVADGTTALEVSHAGHKTSVPVNVSEAANDRPVSFRLDVMPVFMRAGCNTGSCHGAARGKDGFMLSLFGYDPEGDHYRITHELGFRRVNLAVPEESLLIEKSVGSVPHTGGKKFDVGSEYYATLLEWLRGGAKNDAGEVPKVVRLELYPRQAVLAGDGTTQQMVVRAVYTDGTDRDVTNLVVFMTSNENSAQVSESGLITARNRGEAFVMARYDTHTVGSQILVLPKDLQYTRPTTPPANYIDELVNAKLDKLRLLPSGVCDDETYLRRVTIDITGQLPTEQEYLEFVADKDPEKRRKLVDRLLERKEFAEIWAMKWSELLLVRSTNQVDAKSIFLYSSWLTDKISDNVPLDQMVRELLMASGGTFTSPATNYYQVERDTLKTAENTAQVFMGLRIQCAQCHNHPFDRWTMDDYYSFAAFFAQVGRKQGEDYRETIVYDRRGGETQHPVTKKSMPPKYLGGPVAETAGRDRRAALAEWLTSTDNPFFAQNTANRIWEHFFGIGIVDPVDDVRVSNPASNPELLNALAKKLVEYKYDFKQLVRDICASQAYQRSVERNPSNELDEKNFAHGSVRRIRAESLLDCICQVTEAPEKFRGLPLGAKATQISDGATSTYFLDTFGRAPRLSVCSCDVRTEPTLSQSLHLLNGPTTSAKITQGAVVRKLLAAGKTPEQVIETLYIRCLTRRPTAEEMERLMTLVKQDKNPETGLIDIFWALLNSREFVFNH